MNEITNTNDLLNTIAQVLIRCFVMGLVLMLLWIAILLLAGDFVYCLQSKIIPMSRQQFDWINYASIALTKVFILFFFLLPYIAIRLLKCGR